MASPRDFTKAQRRKLRELAALAHERDLAAELAKLEAAFQRWRAQELDAFELSDLIHKFHQGPSRKLFLAYEPPHVDLPVASAIHRGLLTEAEVGAEMLNALCRHLAFFREQDER